MEQVIRFIDTPKKTVWDQYKEFTGNNKVEVTHIEPYFINKDGDYLEYICVSYKEI